jgi:transposase
MKGTQNQKISQIKFETLVVGIDIGKETHYARAFDYRGIELARLLKFSNTDQGFQRLEQWMRDICKQQEKTEIIAGFEPTGHYWFTLGDHLKRQGYKLAIVNPFHVKRTKELDDNSPTKNDRKDPKTIAMLVKDGRYREVYIPDDIYQELREAVSERERLQEQLTSIYNRVVRWLDIRFPEFTTVFKDWRRNAALITLRSFPTPEKIMEMGVDKIVETWRKQMKRASLKRAERLVKAASRSVGRTSGKVASEASLQNLLAEYDLYCQQYDKLYKKKFHQESDLANAYKNLKFKLWGELLTSYAYSINKGDTEVNVLDYYSGENITIKLDPRYTPMQNAQRYFKKYNKSNKAIKHLESLIAKNQEEIDYLDSLLVALNQADSLLEIREIMEEMKKGGYLKENFKTARKEQIQSTPREFVSEDGFKILVGRNNRQNDYLTFKQAARNDIWLHAQGIPGSHVIIRLPKPLESIDEIPISTLLDAASLAACYSKAQGAEKVPVDYTFRYNVRKPTGARPGKVVYDNYWTVYVNPHSERVQKLLTQLQSSVH